MGRMMTGWMQRRARGQALTEFALVVPLLLLMVIGMMEFGRAWSQSQVITDAARQGARMAALLNNSSAGQDSVRRVVRRALAAGNIIATDQMIDIDPTNEGVSGWKAGTNTPVGVSLAIPYDWGVFRPVMTLAQQSFQTNGFRLRSRAVMRNE
jgi:Flp pilus assembly protein TadG